MKLKLKNDILYLDVGLEQNKYNSTVEVDIEYTNEEYKRYVAINDLPFEDINNGCLEITQDVIKNGTLTFKLKLVNRKTRKTKVYQTNPIKADYILTVGDTKQDVYPITCSLAMERIKKIEEKVKLMSAAIVELNKKGEWL